MIETVRIAVITDDDPKKAAHLKRLLRQQERRGEIEIVSLTKRLARIRWIDERVAALLTDGGDHAGA